MSGISCINWLRKLPARMDGVEGRPHACLISSGRRSLLYSTAVLYCATLLRCYPCPPEFGIVYAGDRLNVLYENFLMFGQHTDDAT